MVDAIFIENVHSVQSEIVRGVNDTVLNSPAQESSTCWRRKHRKVTGPAMSQLPGTLQIYHFMHAS